MSIEAESMQYGVTDPVDGTLWPKPESDDAASGGRMLHYGPNGSATKTVTIGATSALTLRARGLLCGGAPNAKVTVDGATVGNVSVASTTWSDYRVPVSLTAGTHRIAIAFNSNYYKAGVCNRDLYLDKLTVTDESTSTTPAPRPAPLWRGDPDAPQGRAEWSAEHMVSAIRTSVATIGGRRAWRMQVNDGDNYLGYGERTEFGQDRDVSRCFHNGDEVWEGYSVYMPTGFPTNVAWTDFTQFKDQDPDLGSPSWETAVKSGKLGIYGGYNMLGGAGWVYNVDAALNVWHNFVIHIKLSSSSNGLLEVYYSSGESRPVRMYTAVRQTYRTSAVMVPRMGYYRDSGISTSAAVYHSHFAVGRSFDAVNPVW